MKDKYLSVIIIVLLSFIFLSCLTIIIGNTIVNSFDDTCEFTIEGRVIVDLNVVESFFESRSVVDLDIPLEYFEINKISGSVPCGTFDMVMFMLNGGD